MRLAFSLSFLALFACGSPNERDSASGLASKIGDYHRDFPIGPALTITPGSLCKSPDEYRYPEGIAYCRRAVSSNVKNRIIDTYDEKFQYSINQMPRSDFKIDHLIPLCMGGANDASNLWPQHKSIYDITDPLEEKFCILLQRALIKQRDAVSQIQYAKLNLDEVPSILKELDEKLGL